MLHPSVAYSFVDMPPVFDTLLGLFRGICSGETCLMNVVTYLEPKFYGKICKIRISVWKQKG